MTEIRDALPEDAARIAEIYSYYVNETAISFEYEAPDSAEMERRIRETSSEYPFLVLTHDGKIEGYAYAHRFSARAAYRRSAEVTIYLDRHAAGNGFGKSLYASLEERLRPLGIHNLYAIVMYPGEGSVEFHEKMGYRIAGKLSDAGEKFGKLWSVVYMEKHI